MHTITKTIQIDVNTRSKGLVLTLEQWNHAHVVIDQLTARGVMDAAALHEPPFSNLHAGGPDALFAGKENVIDALFETLESLEPQIPSVA